MLISRGWEKAMILISPDHTKRISKVIIDAGELYSSDKECVIQTTLGPCVSVCVFDRKNGIAGMNHYGLAQPVSDLRKCDRLRYGIHAMPALVRGLVQLGADRKNLAAKVFGGCSRKGSGRFERLGKRNIEFALSWLSKEHIPIAARDLGGMRPRTLTFNTKTTIVQVSKMPWPGEHPTPIPVLAGRAIDHSPHAA